MNTATKLVPNTTYEGPTNPRVYLCVNPLCAYRDVPVNVTPRRRNRHLLLWPGDIQCTGCGHSPRRVR